jgi:hypothetical protein
MAAAFLRHGETTWPIHHRGCTWNGVRASSRFDLGATMVREKWIYLTFFHVDNTGRGSGVVVNAYPHSGKMPWQWWRRYMWSEYTM